ncbi:MAG: hypothetical protein VKJ64_16265 [Leptolyngbyaceae bacterium]|nr:hypothetical protein [Leptolyngbyaceae bacterium]
MTNPSSDQEETMTLEGVVERSPLGMGTWSIVCPEQTVEIFQAQPEDILQEGLRVRVTGKTRPDVMTLAMIGPVFEVDHFQILE